jgi:hypothetical protein
VRHWITIIILSTFILSTATHTKCSALTIVYGITRTIRFSNIYRLLSTTRLPGQAIKIRLAPIPVNSGLLPNQTALVKITGHDIKDDVPIVQLFVPYRDKEKTAVVHHDVSEPFNVFKFVVAFSERNEHNRNDQSSPVSITSGLQNNVR